MNYVYKTKNTEEIGAFLWGKKWNDRKKKNITKIKTIDIIVWNEMPTNCRHLKQKIITNNRKER